jgi:hypothetical protein
MQVSKTKALRIGKGRKEIAQFIRSGFHSPKSPPETRTLSVIGGLLTIPTFIFDNASALRGMEFSFVSRNI